MKHGSLFSGIGGFDLAAEWMGWENKFHCEWNPFGQKVLKHYWPNAKSYEDITKTDFTIHRGNIDILTGGFPCQPYSAAGKRLGKEDERHLWPHMLRAISEIQPSWVVGENVRGLVNWNDGLVFHEVQSDLENQGYEVQPFLIPAAGINAPHQRYRVWFVAYNDAYTNCNGLYKCDSSNEVITGERGINAQCDTNEGICNGDATNASSKGCEWSSKFRETNHKKWEDSKLWETTSKHSPGSWWETFPTVSPICIGDDGISYGLDNIAFSKWRKESIKAGGNAIVPQVALNIFKAIQAYEDIFLPIHQNKV
jgi:DNA (cytosine-5)-methyltransferase 1